MKAWHFVGDELRNGIPIPADGEWLVHEGELIMCESGLHASRKIIDALIYAPGSTICRVEVNGKIIEDHDKVVAEKRKILWRIDGNKVLPAFARWGVLQVIRNAPNVVGEWLKTGNEELRAESENVIMTIHWETRLRIWKMLKDAIWANDVSRPEPWATVGNVASYVAMEMAWAKGWSVQNEQLKLMVREARNGKTEWVFDIPTKESK